MTDWATYVRDGAGNRVGELGYTRLELTLRHAAPADWAVTVQRGAVGSALVTEALYGVECERHGTLMLTGPIGDRLRTWDQDTDELTVKGYDDLVWLARRQAHPVPALDAPPYSTQAYDVRTGPSETVIKGYVDANAGPGAVPRRRVTGLAVATSLGQGTTITGRARWRNLLELVQELAQTDGWGLTATGLEFDVVPSRTPGVVFSADGGNLGGYEYSEKAPETNYVYVAGQGEGVDRTIVEAFDTASSDYWGLVESFRDRRDTDDDAELAQAGIETLVEATADYALTVNVVDGHGTGRLPTFGVDYRLGDFVTVEIPEATIVERVLEARITVDAEGETIELTVGSPRAARQVPQFFRRLGRLTRDVQNLNAI